MRVSIVGTISKGFLSLVIAPPRGKSTGCARGNESRTTASENGGRPRTRSPHRRPDVSTAQLLGGPPRPRPCDRSDVPRAHLLSRGKREREKVPPDSDCPIRPPLVLALFPPRGHLGPAE